MGEGRKAFPLQKSWNLPNSVNLVNIVKNVAKKLELIVKHVDYRSVKAALVRKGFVLIVKKKRKIPYIPFKEKLHRITRTRHGYPVGQHLIVAPAIGNINGDVWLIYSLITGKPFFNPGLLTKEFAYDLAQWLSELYQNYIDLQTASEYGDSDVILLCRYTVKYGDKLAQIHQDYATEILTPEKFKFLFGSK